MEDWKSITCCYCGKTGERSLLHKDGWVLAKSRIGCYACTVCAHIDKKKDKHKDRNP